MMNKKKSELSNDRPDSDPSSRDRPDSTVEYPLVQGQVSVYPKDGVCPWCRLQPILEPNSFVVLSGGGLLMNRKEKVGGPSRKIDGFLDLTWHEAHGDSCEDEAGKCILPMAQNVFGGQFGVICCSVQCLRGILNHWLDTMEREIDGTKNEAVHGDM